jgi:hypothetical protein
MLSVAIINVILNVIMLSVVMLNVVMGSVVKLSVIRLSVMAPQTEVYLTIVNHNSTSVTMLILQAISYWIPSC